MTKNSLRRPLAEGPASLPPQALGDFLSRATGVLIFHSSQNRPEFTPEPRPSFLLLPDKRVRSAQLQASPAHQALSSHDLLARVRERLPSSNDTKTGKVVGAAVLGFPRMLRLRIESEQLQVEHLAAAQALHTVLDLKDARDPEMPAELHLVVGCFAKRSNPQLRESLCEVVADFTNGATLTFGPIPGEKGI